MRLPVPALLAAAALCGAAWAGDTPTAQSDASSPLPAFEQKMVDAGVTPFLKYYGEEFGNVAGGVSKGGNYEGLLKFGLTLDLDKIVQWKGASLYFAVLYPHGLGITNEYVHDYNVLSNIDAYDSWRLSEAWVQQDFADHHFFLRIGQLTTDNNFFASGNAGLYINSAFGTMGTALHNVLTPIYPVASPGVMVHWTPTPAWTLQAMVVSDNAGAQDGNNKHGVRYDLHTGALLFYEAGYQRTGTEEHPVLEGTYKAGGYYDSGTFQDNRHDFSHHGTYGFYVMADQQLYRERIKPKESFRGLAAFALVSAAPEDRSPVAFYFNTGLNYTGLLPKREKDILGVALSYERLSSELRAADGGPLPSHHEHTLEAAYQYTVNDHLQVQPDLQYIFNPGGIGTTPNALVLGVRVTLNF